MKKIVFTCVLLCLTSVLSHVCSGWESLVREGIGLLGGTARAATGRQDRRKDQSRGSIEDNLVYEPLDRGVYGIPFGADLPTILKWCKDNSVEIELSTEKTIRNGVKAISKGVIAEFYPESVSARTQALLDILKNPSFVYEGTTYFMNKGFGGG